MASTYISIDGSASRLASKVRSLSDQARQMQEMATEVQRVMAIARDDFTDVDASFTTLGGLLGIPAGKAREAYNLLLAFQSVINKPNYDGFIDRLG